MFAKFGKKALRTLAKATRGTSIVFPRAKIYRTNIQALKTTGYDLRYGFWLRCLRNLAKSSSHISKCHRLHEHCVSTCQNVSNEHTSPKKRPATTLDTAFGCDVCEIWQKALRTLANAIDCTRRVCPSAKIYRTNIQALKTTGYDLRYGFWLRCLRNLARSSSHISKCHTRHEHCVSKRQNISNEHTSPKNDRLRP